MDLWTEDEHLPVLLGYFAILLHSPQGLGMIGLRQCLTLRLSKLLWYHLQRVFIKSFGVSAKAMLCVVQVVLFLPPCR